MHSSQSALSRAELLVRLNALADDTRLMVLALILLIPPITRQNEGVLAVACVMLFIGAWIDKGLGMVIAGFVPNPLGQVVHYAPTAPELLISLAIYAIGLLILTGLYKIALEIRGQIKKAEY